MSHAKQQPLEFSSAMRVAIGAVALIAMSGLIDTEHPEEMIVRVSQKTIDFPLLGIRIRSADGWTHLSTSGHRQAQRPTFVNLAAHLIVRFEAWPTSQNAPESADATTRGVVQDDGKAPAPADAVMRQNYTHVSILWNNVEATRTIGPRPTVGRLRQPNVDIKVTVMSHSDGVDGDESVRRLCDAIELM